MNKINPMLLIDFYKVVHAEIQALGNVRGNGKPKGLQGA